MPLELIGVDWNDTLIDQEDESPLFKYIGMKLLSRSLPGFLAKMAAKKHEYQRMIDIARNYDGFRWRFHPLDAMNLAKTESELRKMLDTYRSDFRGKSPDSQQRERFLREMYRIYNERIIDGLPVGVVNCAVVEYANTIAKGNIDEETLTALGRLDTSIPKVVISSGYTEGIKETLRVCNSYFFNRIIGNGLDSEDDIAKGFRLDVYKNKDMILKNLIGDYHANPKNTAYIGDDPDLDGPAMAIAGRPIVSLLASEGQRQIMALRYKARTPRTSAELLHALETD